VAARQLAGFVLETLLTLMAQRLSMAGDPDPGCWIPAAIQRCWWPTAAVFICGCWGLLSGAAGGALEAAAGTGVAVEVEGGVVGLRGLHLSSPCNPAAAVRCRASLRGTLFDPARNHTTSGL
jgi:hypothetical protein